MSLVRWNLDTELSMRVAELTSASTTTTAFDFGTPNDVNMLDHTIYPAGCRILILLTAKRAAGSTDALTYLIQDADDSAGSFGTPATATTSGTLPSFAADSGAVQKAALISLKVKPGRPWIRVSTVQSGGGTDSFQCHCAVIAVTEV